MTFSPIYFLGLLSTGCVSVVWGFSVLLGFFPFPCLGNPSQIRLLQHFVISFTRELVSTNSAFRVLTEQDVRILASALHSGGLVNF